MEPEAKRAYTEWAHVAMPGLHRLAVLACHDPHRAQDLVQTALERMYLAWDRGMSDPTAYARRVLINGMISEQRRPFWQRERATETLPEMSGLDPTAATTEHVVLVQALRGLPPRQRMAVVLRHLEDLPVATVAELMGCSASAVKTNTEEGLRKLRVALGAHEEARL